MKNLLKITLLLCCFAAPGFASSNPDIIKKFIAAYNQKDLGTMLSMTAPAMKWLSVTGHQISIETSNQQELKSAMQGYFDSMPDARSEVRNLHHSGPFVYALEEAFWTVEGTEKSQCSMAIYELADEKIKHVWYFPSHEC